MTVTQNRAKKTIASNKRLGLPLEPDLIVFTKVLQVFCYAHIKNRIQFVPVSTTQIQGHEVFHLLQAVNLLSVKLGLQVVQLVGVGFAGLYGGAVVILERRLHCLGIVGEVEHEGVVLLWMRPVQA